jgi:hypothetical protein
MILALGNTENAMISLNKTTFSTSAPIGTVVGTLSLLNASVTSMGATFILTDGCAGFFAISGYNIVTLSLIPVGNYSIRVNAVGTKTYWDDKGVFQISVTP